MDGDDERERGDRSSAVTTPARRGAHVRESEQARDGEREPARDGDITGYDVGRELGRGGMGRIVEAQDRELQRPVAIKRLLASTDDAAERFRREAHLTARLQHPGIVPVYAHGTDADGAPYYAMRLVEGTTLATTIDEARTAEQRIALVPIVQQVADTIAYAHAQQVIHRDLKPNNIMLGPFGETLVVDWGIAKDLATDDADGARMTAHGTVMGTPSYMAPEQAAGDDVDERTDVYALGAILYHVLAGGVPSREALAVRAPTAPPALIAIAEKAMAEHPEERYPTAREFADDLRRFLTGQLVAAHRYSIGERAARLARRYRNGLLAVVAAIVAAGIVAVVMFARVLEARDAARVERDAAIVERARGELDRDPSRLESLVQHLDHRDVPVLRASARASGVADVRELGVAPTAVASIGGRTWIGAEDGSITVDGAHVAQVDSGHVAQLDGGHVAQLDGGHVAKLDGGHVAQLDGGHVAQLDGGHVAKLDGGHVAQLDGGHVARLDGTHVAPLAGTREPGGAGVGSLDRDRVAQPGSASVAPLDRHHVAQPDSAGVAPLAGTRVAQLGGAIVGIAAMGERAVVWDGVRIVVFDGTRAGAPIACAGGAPLSAVVPRMGRAVCAGAQGAELVDLASGERRSLHTDLLALAHIDKTRIVARDGAGTVRVFDAATLAEIATLPPDRSPTAIALAGDRVVVARGSEVVAWDPGTGALDAYPDVDTAAAAIVASDDGARVAVLQLDGTLRIFDARERRQLRRVTVDSGAILLGFEPGGDRLALAIHSELHLVPVGAARRWRLRGHAAPISDIAWTARGPLSVAQDQTLRAWQLDEPVAVTVDNAIVQPRVAFARDSTRMLVWDLTALREVVLPAGPIPIVEQGVHVAATALPAGPVRIVEQGVHVAAAAYTDEGAIVIAEFGGRIRRDRVELGRVEPGPLSITISPDGDIIVRGAATKKRAAFVRAWDRAGSPREVPPAAAEPAPEVGTSGSSRSIRVSRPGAAPIALHARELDGVRSVTWSATNLLAVVSRDHACVFAPHRSNHGYCVPHDRVGEAWFSPDGRWLVTSAPGEALVWSVPAL